MNTGTTVVGYVRKSVVEAENGHSLDAQERAIRAECEHRGWILRDVVRDDGYSGRDADRPGLRQALDLIADGQAGGLVVSKLDRLSRSVVDFGTLLDWFQRAGAALVALDMGIDTSTPNGRMVANVMMSVAEWEREIIGQRTRDALAVAAAKGRRPAPAIADDAKLARRIRTMRSRGMSLDKIAAKLNADGVSTLRGGAKWHKSAVQSVLGYKRPPARRKAANLPDVPRRRRAA